MCVVEIDPGIGRSLLRPDTVSPVTLTDQTDHGNHDTAREECGKDHIGEDADVRTLPLDGNAEEECGEYQQNADDDNQESCIRDRVAVEAVPVPVAVRACCTFLHLNPMSGRRV